LQKDGDNQYNTRKDKETVENIGKQIGTP
jgi:hypothetical protein